MSRTKPFIGLDWGTTSFRAYLVACRGCGEASPQAEVARQDWERWLPHVSELTVEVYARLSPLPTYHHWN